MRSPSNASTVYYLLPKDSVVNCVNNAIFALTFEMPGVVWVVDLYIPPKWREKTNSLSEVLLNMLILFYFST